MKTFSTLLFLVNVGWLGGFLSAIKKTSDKQNQVNNSLKVI